MQRGSYTMNYDLNLNSNDKLDGVQRVGWVCCGNRFTFSETQFFSDGNYEWGFVVVLDRETYVTYNFDADRWGGMQNARDAAEKWSEGWDKVVMVPGSTPKNFNALPYTEEAMV